MIMLFNVLCFLELITEREASNFCYDLGAMIGSVDDAFGMHSYSYLYVYEIFFSKCIPMHVELTLASPFTCQI